MVKIKFMIEKCPVKDLGYSQRLKDFPILKSGFSFEFCYRITIFVLMTALYDCFLSTTAQVAALSTQRVQLPFGMFCHQQRKNHHHQTLNVKVNIDNCLIIIYLNNYVDLSYVCTYFSVV